MTEDGAAPAEAAQPSTTNPAVTLDLNPTAFLDDLYNAVEVNCAEGFEELDRALRAGLQHQLTPEQFTVLLTGTAGLYQDLRAELKNRMQTFEQYALAEILKIPPGLLANPAELADGAADVEAVTEEEEAAVDAELLTLQKDIASNKRRGRETQSAIAEIDRLMTGLRQRLEKLQTVPGVLGSKENLLEDMNAIAAKGIAVEAGCVKLDALRASAPNSTTADNPSVRVEGGELSDADVEREILRRQGAVKSAPTEDMRAIRETLGL